MKLSSGSSHRRDLCGIRDRAALLVPPHDAKPLEPSHHFVTTLLKAFEHTVEKFREVYQKSHHDRVVKAEHFLLQQTACRRIEESSEGQEII